jgi:hypothetical protein
MYFPAACGSLDCKNSNDHIKNFQRNIQCTTTEKSFSFAFTKTKISLVSITALKYQNPTMSLSGLGLN